MFGRFIPILHPPRKRTGSGTFPPAVASVKEVTAPLLTVTDRAGRRSVLHAGMLAALGLSGGGSRCLAAQARRDRSVLLLWLWGGPSHLDLFDPKPDAPTEYRGPYAPLRTAADGILFTELLPGLARQAKRLSVLRTLHHESNDHGVAGTIALTGRAAQAGAVQPHFGSVLQRLDSRRSPLGSFVTVGERLQQGHRLIQGEGGGILGAVYDPLRVTYDRLLGAGIGELRPPENLQVSRILRRRAIRRELQLESAVQSGSASALQSLYERAFSMIGGGEAMRAFNLEEERPELRRRYGLHRFGQSCLLGRRLVEAGVPLVQVNWSTHVEAEEDAGDGGWDNHYRNFEMLMERQALPFDQAFSTLLSDLHDRGLLEQTMVVVAGEFGRTPRINANAGRDHWQSCYSALVAGGGTRGGQAIGISDEKGEYPASRPLSPADLLQTMLHHLGISRTAALAAGLTPEGETIEDLW